MESLDKKLVANGTINFKLNDNLVNYKMNDDGIVECYKNNILQESKPFSKLTLERDCKILMQEGYSLIEELNDSIDTEKTKQELEQDIKDVDELQTLKDELNDKVDKLMNEDKELDTIEEFEVSELKDKALELLPKEDIDTHDSDLYIKVTPESTKLISKMKNKDNGLLSTFKDQISGAMWYDIPFGNVKDDYKNRLQESKTEDTIIKDWYVKEYSQDELGKQIKEDVTFKDLFTAMDSYKDVYDVIGVDDSVVRERVFEKLAEIMDVDYEYVYDQWLKCEDKLEEEPLDKEETTLNESTTQEVFPSTEFTSKVLTIDEINNIDLEKELTIEQIGWIITNIGSLENLENAIKELASFTQYKGELISLDEYIKELV